MRRLLCVLALLWATPASAATYYVAASGGLDSRSCATAQTITTPKLTIGSGVTCLSAGDTLYLRTGTYAEILEWFGHPFVSQGTSWATAITISAYNGEAVTIKPGGSSQPYIVVMRGSSSGATNAPKYVIFYGITFDGTNVSGNYEIGIRAWDATTTPNADAPAHHIRFQHGRITNGQAGQGILVSWGSDGVEILDMEIDHNNGPTNVPNNTQGIYGAANDLLVEYCNIHDNWGYGISNINSVPGLDNSRQIIRFNTVHNNGLGGTGLGGINLGEGTGNQIYNNLVYGNAGPGIILGFGNGSDGTVIYNNTVYNNTGKGIYVRTQDVNANVRNNISYLNSSGSLGNYDATGTSGTIENHNLFGSDPGFTNAAGANFTIALGTSPAVNAGVTLALFSTDYAGASRPQGSGWDIGAYEFGNADVNTPATGTIFVSDTFTGTAGTAWAFHVGEIGATWTKHPNGSVGPVLSDANRLRSNSAPGNTFHYASGVPVSTEYDVSADFVFKTHIAGSAYQLLGRVSTTTESFYIGNFNVDTGRAELEVATSGSYNEVGSCDRTVADNGTMSLLLEIRDTIKKLYTKIAGTDSDWVFCTSSTDNNIITMGRAGAAIYSPTTAGTNTTDVHIDNFVARDVQTAPPSPTMCTICRLRFHK